MRDDDGAAKAEIELRVSREVNRIKRLLKEVPKAEKETVLSLIKNAAFMTVTLEDLQESINANGIVSEYKNGENQFGSKKSPEVEVYNAMIKNHMSIMKQLTDLIPAKPTPTDNDELMGFLKKKVKR